MNFLYATDFLEISNFHLSEVTSTTTTTRKLALLTKIIKSTSAVAKNEMLAHTLTLWQIMVINMPGYRCSFLKTLLVSLLSLALLITFHFPFGIDHPTRSVYGNNKPFLTDFQMKKKTQTHTEYAKNNHITQLGNCLKFSLIRFILMTLHFASIFLTSFSILTFSNWNSNLKLSAGVFGFFLFRFLLRDTWFAFSVVLFYFWQHFPFKFT